MINLFVEFGFQVLNMVDNFNTFQARNITIILTMFRKTKMLENTCIMIIFIPEKVLICTCVEMPVIFLVKFLNLLLHKVQFPLWKTKYFLGQFMTADDMHDRSTSGFQNAWVCLQAFSSCLVPFFVTLKNFNLMWLSTVGNKFPTQIIYAYRNTVDRDQVTVNKKYENTSLTFSMCKERIEGSIVL